MNDDPRNQETRDVPNRAPSGPRFSPGTTISGRYELEAFVARGGMGEVYKARDGLLGIPVALKTVLPEVASDPSAVERFKREVRLARSITHPNVCRVFDLGQHTSEDGEEHLFFTMELLAGESLSARIRRRGAFADFEIAKLAFQMASALGAAHKAGIVHRDFKASNVILVPEPGAERAVVTDFGLARDLEPRADHPTITAMGAVMGTPAYMAPEQVRGEATGPATDIYALGVVMYEMATGKLPFSAETTMAAAVKRLLEDPPPPRSLAPSLDPNLEAVILRCLEREPVRRFESAAELVAHLEAATPSERPTTRVPVQPRVPSSPSGNVGSARDVTTRGVPPSEPLTLDPSSPRSLGPAPRRLGKLVVPVLGLLLAAAGYLGYRGFTGATDGGRILLAVLPFENRSPSAEEEYLVDGMTEQTIAQLAQLQPERLGVIARTSAMSYKGKQKSVQQIGRELGVGYILESSMGRAGDQVQITTQLVDVEDQTPVWAKTYQTSITDVFAIQNDVAQQIARALALELLPEEGARLESAHPVRSEAYQAYLKGRYFWNKRTADDFLTGLQYFTDAVELDPLFAPAHSGLADTYNMLARYAVYSPEDAFPKAKAAAHEALRLDENLAEAYVSLAYAALHYDWDFDTAESHFQKAMSINPGYSTAHQWYARHLTAMGRHEEAIRAIEEARKLDPLSLIVNAAVGYAYYFARDYDRAVKENLKVIEMDESFARAYFNLGLAYEQQSAYPEAVSAFESSVRLSGDNPEYLAALGHVHALSGKRAEAERILRAIEQTTERYVSPEFPAVIHVALGATDEALPLLETAFEQREGQLVFIGVDPRFNPLRSDPRFQDLLKRIGIPH